MDWPVNYQDKFWRAYPRHIDKKKALAKLEVIRKSKKTDFSDIIAGVESYVKWLKGPGWRPEPKWPTTWLNGECWNDQFDGSADRQSGQSAFIAGMANVAARYGLAGERPDQRTLVDETNTPSQPSLDLERAYGCRKP